MQPWTSEEHLISQEILEEAHATFSSHFKPEAWFERTVHLSWQNAMNCTLCHFAPKTQTISPESAKRSLASLTAEVHLAHQLNWRIQLSTGYLPHRLDYLLEVCKKITAITDQKLWLETFPIPGSDLDLLRPYLEGISIPLETINKGTRKRLHLTLSQQQMLTMFDDASHLKKGITIMLGLGENLQDIAELHHFITMNHLDKVTFLPVIPHRNTPYKKMPSSFYLTRWIAETRIACPKVEISAGTWKNRVAEVGLFMKAGANAITKFQAIKHFHTEDAHSIEQEIKTSGRVFLSTLTNIEKVQQLKDRAMETETKEKIMRYIQAIQEHK